MGPFHCPGDRFVYLDLSLYRDMERGLQASVRLELKTVEEAIRASEAVGGDRLQRRVGREGDPDSSTHGSSAQRRNWFEPGTGAVGLRRRASATRKRSRPHARSRWYVRRA